MSECSYLKLYAARSRSEMEQSGIEYRKPDFLHFNQCDGTA